MNKKFLVFGFVLLGTSLMATGQKDPKAEEILASVSEKYQSLDGLKATFEYTYSDADGGKQANTGEISVKGDKYRLVLDNQEIYNNGKTVWTYIKSNNNYEEVTINHANLDKEELTPSSIYNIYKKGYNYKLIGETVQNGKTVQEIELTSEKPSSQFRKIKLSVDKESKDLIGWEIHDDVDGVFEYRFKEVDSNVRLSDDYFAFNIKAHRNIEVIDLR